MTPTDVPRAQRALALVGGIFLTQAGLSLVSRFAPFQAAQVLWLLVDGALLYAAWELKACASNELTNVLFPVSVVNALFGALSLYGSLSDAGMRSMPQAFWMAGTIVGVGTTLSFLAVVAKLGDSVPFAAGIAIFALLRTVVTLSMPQLVAALGPSTLLTVIRVLLSVIVSAGIGVLALQARGKLELATPGALGAAPAPVGPAVVAETGAAGLIATGAVLLLLGIGGSLASFAAASSGSGGGRYIVATGLIASGLVQLVRGLGRLGKSP